MTVQTKKENRALDYLNNHSRLFVIGVSILVGLALSAFFGLMWAYRNVAAVVGDEFVMKTEVKRQLEINYATSKITKDKSKNSFKAAKQQLVDKALIQTIAAKNKIKVEDTELNAEIKRIADEMYSGNIDYVYQAYKQSYGYSKDELDDQIHYQLLEEKVRAKLVNNVTANYIGVKSSVPDAEKLAQDLLAKTADKNSFDAVYDQIVYGENYSADIYDAGVWNALIYDNSKFSMDEWNKVLSAKSGQTDGLYQDNQYYHIIYPTQVVDGQVHSFKALVDSYEDEYLKYDMDKVDNIFAYGKELLLGKKAYACVLCWADNAHTCAIYYCKCNECKSLCGPDSNHAQAPRCPSGERCTLSPYVACAVWPGTEYCNNSGCGTGGPITPPAQPVNGVCGSSDGNTYVWDNKPTSSLCSFGSPTSVTKVVRDGTDRWTWKCTGSNGGSTSSCSADIAYKMTVIKEGCGAGRVTDDRDPHKINCGGDCSGNFTAQWVELKQNPITGNAFVAWEKLWSGATDCKDNIFCNVSMGDNRRVRATFGYTVRVTINGKGKVVDNRDPHKINCTNTDPNSSKTCERKVYSATGLKLVASSIDTNYPFIKWSGDPCGTNETNTTCNFSDRCQNSNLIVANFRTNPVDLFTCDVTPVSGFNPLVVRVDYDPDAKNTIDMGDGAPGIRSNVPDPFYYTYQKIGSKTVQMRFDANGDGVYESAASCGIVNVKAPNSATGGEVSP